MENLILAAHVIIAFIIVGLIMVQQGKGAEMGASFGTGGSQTVFGASGAGNFFSRLTAIFAVIFFVTSVALAIVARNTSEIDAAGFVVSPDAEAASVEVKSAPGSDVDTLEQGAAEASAVLDSADALEGGVESTVNNAIDAGADALEAAKPE